MTHRIATSADPDDRGPAFVLTRWMVPDGGRVEVGQKLCELDSDTSGLDINADRPGTLHHLKGEGETVDLCDELFRIT